jgi:hypothetical protein
MRAYPLRGEVGGGWALEFSSFLGPVKWHGANRRVPFGAQKLENSTSPNNGYACIQNIMHRSIGCFLHTSPLVTLTGCILGRSRAHTVGGWRSRNLITLLGPLRETRKLITLLHPSYSPPPTRPPRFSPTDSPPPPPSSRTY